MNRPRDALLQAVTDDLRPLVEKMRRWGWPAEIRVETDGTEDGRCEVLVSIRLDGVRVPIESS